MKKTIAIVLLVVAGGLLAWIYFTREPSADGRTLSEWLGLGMMHSLTFVRSAGDDAEHNPRDDMGITNALRKIGAVAVPTLLAKLHAQDPAWKGKIADTWVQNILPDRWLYSAWVQRAEAKFGFSVLGTQAVSALPELSKMCLDTNESSDAALALGYVGPEALPLLKSALTNQNNEIRRCAAVGMVVTREMARLSFPDILALRNESDWVVAHKALAEADRVLPKAESLIIATNFLCSSNTQIRTTALMQMARWRTNYAAAIPFISPLLTNSRLAMREAATNALLKINPKLVTTQSVSPL